MVPQRRIPILFEGSPKAAGCREAFVWVSRFRPHPDRRRAEAEPPPWGVLVIAYGPGRRLIGESFVVGHYVREEAEAIEGMEQALRSELGWV